MTEARRIVTGADYYRTLGVPYDASAQDIRRAYRRLARQLHPDISGQTTAADGFRAVSEAYEVLHDPERRARYDDRVRTRTPNPVARTPRSPTVTPTTDAEAVLELSAHEAALAATVPVTLTDAHGNSIELPAGIRHGQRLRIHRGGTRLGSPPGDLILTVQVRAAAPYLT